jgi:hypothetical protein
VCARLGVHRQLLYFLGLVVGLKKSSLWRSQLVK